MEEHRLDPEQWDEWVAQVDGPQLVVAGPGAGKTEFLVRRAAHLIDQGLARPEEPLLLSFGRRGVADLRRRVEERLDRSFTQLAASTFHSLAHRILEVHAPRLLGWSAMPTLLTGPEQVLLTARLLRGEDPHRWPPPFRPMLATATLANEVADFIQRCRERLIDAAELEARAADRADWRALPGFLRRYDAELERSNRLDYGGLLVAAVRMLDDTDVVATLADQHPYLLVDEYQDTTLVQAEILHRLYAPHRNVTVAGDPLQSIYSFRGADLDNVARFPEAFPDREGNPARRIVLTTSFRVPEVLLRAAEQITGDGDVPGAAGPVASRAGGGSVEAYAFTQLSEEAEWIAREIQRLHTADGIRLSQMAVLVRTKRRFLAELSRALDRRGIPHDRPDARLADQPAVRMVLDMVIAATEEGSEQEQAIRRLLLGPLFRLSLGAWRRLRQDRVGERRSWPEGIADAGPAELAALVADPSWATDRPAAHGLWAVWDGLPQLMALTAADPGHGRALASLGQVLERFNEREPRATLHTYLRLVEAEEFEATPLLGFRPPQEDVLTVTTLHQAKGLDFEAAFIADANEGVFPDLRIQESLLHTRHLALDAPAERHLQARRRLREEMRLAYTAMCRARRRVVWTATSEGTGEAQQGPSRFLRMLEPEPSLPTGDGTTPVTRSQWEAELRRRLLDPGRRSPERLAALTALAEATAHGLRHPDHYHGRYRVGSDRGLVPPGAALSPTQAQLHEACPFRYAVERRLGLSGDGSAYRELGSLVHDTLEAVERRAMERELVHATTDEAEAELEERFDPVRFGGEPWATAWHRRAVQLIRNLYGAWPGEEWVPVDHERPVELELEDVVWRGRVDRIDRRGDALRIIDYKTGSKTATVPEAAGSLQLGFYALAVEDDDALEGRVAVAELWYLQKTNRQGVMRRALDVDNLPQIRDDLVRVGREILAELWEPRPGRGCLRCPVREICPAWPEGREAFP